LANVKIYLHNYLLIMFVTDLPYFGSISFIKKLLKEEAVYFDINQPFSKMSFKNRMVIATAQGPLHLSIPIIGGRDQKTPIKDIQIAYDSPWYAQHFKALVSNYQRSPYFEYYKDSLLEIYESKPVKLVDFLLETNIWINKQLKAKLNLQIYYKFDEAAILLTTNEINNNEDLNRWYDPWKPKNYDQFPDPVKYLQVFEDKTGFLPNLSILDLLFNCGGKQAKELLLV
jgi:hypothetical protein